jgi:Ala-tRNA(Pro) deacylase
MSVRSRLCELLDQHRATYAVLMPPVPEGGRGSSRPAGLPARPMAATVVIAHGGVLSLAVLPANLRVDLPRLSAALRDPVGLADEREVAAAFPDCEAGAVPPFGVLYGLKTYVDESLTHERTITFKAGTHAEAIRMPFEEYRRVAAPVVLWLAESLAETEG